MIGKKCTNGGCRLNVSYREKREPQLRLSRSWECELHLFHSVRFPSEPGSSTSALGSICSRLTFPLTLFTARTTQLPLPRASGRVFGTATHHPFLPRPLPYFSLHYSSLPDTYQMCLLYLVLPSLSPHRFVTAHVKVPLICRFSFTT